MRDRHNLGHIAVWAAAAVVAALVLGGTANAAVVTWDSWTSVTDNTAIQSPSGYTIGEGVNLNGSDTTINNGTVDVSFVGIGLNASGSAAGITVGTSGFDFQSTGNNSNVVSAVGSPQTWGTVLDRVIGDFGSGAAATFTLSNLTQGTNYFVQFFSSAPDANILSDSIITSGGVDSPAFGNHAGGGTKYIFATFTADGTSQAFTISGTEPTYSALTIGVMSTAPSPDLYWDLNGTEAGAGGGSAPAGVWNAGNAYWNPKADGTGSAAAWTAGKRAVFAAGSNATDPYVVDVDGTHDIVGLRFEEGAVTIATTAAGQLRLVGDGDAEVAAGLTATIQTAITEGATRSLAKKGDGTLVLSPGVVGYTGGTAVRAGMLQLAGNGVLNGTGVTVGGNAAGVTATLDLNNHDDTVSSLTLDGSTATSAAAVTTGAGTLTLGGNVTYVGTNNPLGATISGKLDLGAVTRTFTVNDSTSTTSDLTVSANISGAGVGLTKAGAGTLVLSGTNTYSGPTTLSAGILRTTAPAVLPGYDSPGNVVFNGGTLLVVLDGGWTIGDVETVATNATKTSGTVALDTSSGDVAQSTAWNLGGLGLTKLGSNTLTLNQANTYTGPTTVSGGTLRLAHADAISSSSGLVIQSGNVVLDTNATLKAVTFVGTTASTVSGSSNLNFSAGGVIDMALDASVTHTFSCGITGSPAVRMASANAANVLRFAPDGTNQQALGVITNPYYDGAGDKAQLILGGTTTGNTVDGITYQKPSNPSQHYGYTNKEGTGTWTVNGDVEQGRINPNGGTLIINGTFTSLYQGLGPILSGARLGGALTYYQGDSRFGAFTVNSGGIVAPGNPAVAGGVGKITTSWSTGQATVATTTFKTGSIFEWQIGDDGLGNVITDTVYALRTTTAANNNRALTVEAGMILKILDAGGTVANDTTPLPVFTYDAGVVRTLSLGSVVFNTDELGAEWIIGTLALTDDGAGTIYLTGLTNVPTAVPGDTNEDGVVDAADFITLKRNFGTGEGGNHTVGNFDETGTVDWADLNILTTNMGTGGPAPAMTPEPATLGLLMVGALAVIRRRRK